jgi:hypothetical protein
MRKRSAYITIRWSYGHKLVQRMISTGLGSSIRIRMFYIYIVQIANNLNNFIRKKYTYFLQTTTQLSMYHQNYQLYQCTPLKLRTKKCQRLP